MWILAWILDGFWSDFEGRRIFVSDFLGVVNFRVGFLRRRQILLFNYILLFNRCLKEIHRGGGFSDF